MAIQIDPKARQIWAELDDNQPVMEISRHWFGLAVWLGAILAILLGFSLVLYFYFADDLSLDRLGFIGTVVLFLGIFLMTGFWLIRSIYLSNKLILTKEEVIQIKRVAFFHNQDSHLGLANIEDVTAVRGGLFAQLFNFGVLTIETAGEQDNFAFKYCPQVQDCAELIMAIRESYLGDNPGQRL